MNNPKLSIVTINYNAAEDLQKTIESVVSQTFTDFEYIVIDGGSTDDSVDVIKEYADRITYWVSESDKGIYNAMNKGILRAKGEYIQFLNSGDSLYDNDVLHKVFVQNACHADIITGDMLKLYSYTTMLEKGKAYVKRESGLSLTLFDMYCDTISHSSSFIKRKLFDEYGLYDENYKIVSDWVFFLKTIGLHNVKVQYVDVIISAFDMSGISSSNMELRDREREDVLSLAIPPSILADYAYFQKLEAKQKELGLLERKYNYVFKYKFTFFIARAMNKSIRLVCKVFRCNG